MKGINIRRFVSMYATVIGFLMINIGCGAATPDTQQSMTLVQDGQPVATIVLAKEPTRAAALAAAELQEHIRKITGAKVPVVTDDSTPSGIRILVGESAATRELGLKSADFKSQEYLIRAYPDTLVLMGRDKPDLVLSGDTVAVSGKPQWVEGKFGKALAFDGTNDALAVKDSGFTDDKGTMDAWVNFAAAANDGGTIFRLDGEPWTYHIVHRQGNSINYISYESKNGTSGNVMSAPLTEGWHHVVATHDAKAGKMELFIDGRSQGTANYVQTTCRNRTLWIGGGAAAIGEKIGNAFAGLIDEVRVSAAVIAPASGWAVTPCAVDDNIVALLRFNAGKGLPKRDKTLQQVLREPPLPNFYDEQATCYAVYDFLERFCSVRWFNPTDSGTICPQTKTLTVNVSTVRRAPAFAMRIYNMTYGDYEIRDASMGTLWPRGTDGYNAWETAAWAETHKRFPDAGQYAGPYALAKRRAIELFMHRMRRGGEMNYCGHSFYGYYDRFWRDGANKSKFFVEKRPDYFAKGYEGAGEPPQLCYTNRGLIEQVAADARAYYDGKGAEIGLTRQLPNMFEVEPMDNTQFCKCPECQKWLNADEEKSVFFSNGRHSDYFFNFVNEVARELHKTHPDKYVSTLAYMSHAATPESVKMEHNVSVQFCFACNRLVYDRPSYEHELNLLEAWGKETGTRPVYLWLYPLFPWSNAQGGNYHCFPGFFAHAIGEQFKLFYRYGYRGMYSDGYGQEVEAYLTDKMMDDPTLEVDRILNDYFQGLYGAAATPMKQIYLNIEKIYSDPKNYPPEIATGKIEGHHHQTEEIAWGWLGTEEHMKELGGLMEQARAAASTEIEKQRVALFDKGVWQYMLAGRTNYIEKRDEITLENSQKLPDAWKIMIDPSKEGIKSKWFDVSFDDSLWKEASILECLEKQGYKDYKYAWYRINASVPKEWEGEKIILYLGAVDETCWLWINGSSAGEFIYNATLDPGSWEKPLRFDITKFVRLGGNNQITVLVQNDAGAGGIWKPSYILYKPHDWNPGAFKVISQP
ncbi:MAG: DUF4838 domain-containing protein [Candidatus Omnitrophota bacterium]